MHIYIYIDIERESNVVIQEASRRNHKAESGQSVQTFEGLSSNFQDFWRLWASGLPSHALISVGACDN